MKFHYTGDFSYSLSSTDTGFIIRSQFRTMDNNATNMNSNITLATIWFGYVFDNVQFRLSGQSIEHIHNPGIVMDTFFHIENYEFKYQNGELVGFILDTSSEILDTIFTRQGNVVGADAAAVIASVNNANRRNIQKNENYNNGLLDGENYTFIQLLLIMIFVN